MKKNLHIFLPSFENYAGHEIQFIDILNLFTKKKTLSSVFILPKTNKIKFKGNIKRILNGKKENFPITKILNIFKNFRVLKKYFATEISPQKKNIIYVDGYSFYFLVTFFLILIFTRNKNLSLMLWIRYPYNDIIRKNIFKIFLYLANKYFKKKIFLTENILLKKKLIKNFRLSNLNLMPSLHNLYELNKKFYHIKIKKYQNKNKINFLCPGVFREEKYGSNLINFLKKNQKIYFQLKISRLFQSKVINYKKINYKMIFIKDNLNIKNHIQQIIDTDFIILPYQMPNYAYRTSGIFFESISLNKPTLITDGTLLSKDLKKFNLDYLIVKDWKKLSVDFIKKQSKVKKNILNLKKIASYYRSINGSKNFTKHLVKIANL